MSTDRMTVNGIELEVLRRGAGSPVLLLHGIDTVQPQAAFLDLLGKDTEIIAPSSPGFGNTKRPDDFDTMYDLVHLYLAVLDELPYNKVALLGLSFGGWLAAEVAAASCHRLSKLVLVCPEGVKVGPPDKLDIPDIYAMPHDELERISYHDPAHMQVDPSRLSDEELSIQVRNRETTALLVWEPYMHNPKLRHRLHRITAPTLFVRGESDGLVSAEYVTAYARLLPNARIATIAAAGHSPHIEQPANFARVVLEFLS